MRSILIGIDTSYLRGFDLVDVRCFKALQRRCKLFSSGVLRERLRDELRMGNIWLKKLWLEGKCLQFTFVVLPDVQSLS